MKKKADFATVLPPIKPPDVLGSEDEIKCYLSLREAAIQNPKVTVSHTEALCNAAVLLARLNRLRAAVGKLGGEFLVETPQGSKVNPLLPELRATESLFNGALGACLLTPRATAAARQPMTPGDRKAKGEKDGLASIDSKTAELFNPRVYRGRKASG